MLVEPPSSPSPVALNWGEVFPGSTDGEREYINFDFKGSPVHFFVGRNGSGKSRTAKLIAAKSQAHFLSTDRLLPIMGVTTYRFGAISQPESYQGIPLGIQERRSIDPFFLQGSRTLDELYCLKEQPDVALRVAAFIRRALGRNVELRESSGFLDPVVTTGGVTYSLFRDEGHGLRELVILLTACYRQDWQCLVVDEPELHLHDSMTRLWLAELEAECRRSERTAVVVTHAPEALRAKSFDDLRGVWYFSAGHDPRVLASCILDAQKGSSHYFVGPKHPAPGRTLVQSPSNVGRRPARRGRAGRGAVEVRVLRNRGSNRFYRVWR